MNRAKLSPIMISKVLVDYRSQCNRGSLVLRRKVCLATLSPSQGGYTISASGPARAMRRGMSHGKLRMAIKYPPSIDHTACFTPTRRRTPTHHERPVECKLLAHISTSAKSFAHGKTWKEGFFHEGEKAGMWVCHQQPHSSSWLSLPVHNVRCNSKSWRP